ncbi:hypothetical protein BJ878DRAFT_113425 [Calycina marina]|uniref:Uncharacterized protein n=1 Tax=Calycina marina TaxID=1763456 RepID=A0A9P8CEC5_9HELO|nr:hypothetical protein BJ878DRAFT_113425 [Calycina marina]
MPFHLRNKPSKVLEQGDICHDYQAGLFTRNNYAPWIPCPHPHEYKFHPEKSNPILSQGDRSTPLSVAKANAVIKPPSCWDGPTFVGQILMAKPPGNKRPENFKEVKAAVNGEYRPRKDELHDAFRTLWRCNTRSEKRVDEKLKEKAKHMEQNEALELESEIDQESANTSALPVQFWGKKIASVSKKTIHSMEHDERRAETLHVIPIPFEKSISVIELNAGPAPEEHILPRGLIVPCREQVDPRYKPRDEHYGFHGGFPFPEILKQYGITQENWQEFTNALDDVVRPYATNAPWFGAVKLEGEKGADIPQLIDTILYTVAEWELKLFRPRGLLMRMDMPGEAKFGLTAMDIYHKARGKRGHIDNCLGVLSRRAYNFEKNESFYQPRWFRHLLCLLESTYASTRIVIDEASVMDDPKLAYERGWMVWIAACHWAHVVKETHTDCCDLGPMRSDRWPRSKHFYYERFVGTLSCTARALTHSVMHAPIRTISSTSPNTSPSSHRLPQTTWTHQYEQASEQKLDPHGTCVWRPAIESMDQRTHMFATRPVLPADCAPTRVRCYLNRRFETWDTGAYWRTWALEVLELDGYFDGSGDKGLGNVYKRTGRNMVSKAQTHR